MDCEFASHLFVPFEWNAGRGKPLPLYYKAAATVARLASACYTAEDAVDWFPPLTA